MRYLLAILLLASSLFAQTNTSLGTALTSGGIQYKTLGARPSCDVAHRGWTWITWGAPGVADIAQVCTKTAADTYVWVTANSPRTLIWNIENPLTSDSGRFQYPAPTNGGTLVALSCNTDPGRTAVVSMEVRTSPNATGTDLLASPLSCSDTGANTSTFVNPTIPANSLLALKIVAANATIVRVNLSVLP